MRSEREERRRSGNRLARYVGVLGTCCGRGRQEVLALTGLPWMGRAGDQLGVQVAGSDGQHHREEEEEVVRILDTF